MLYHLFDFLHSHYDFFGAGVFKYISFRASMALIFSLFISLIIGKKIIYRLQKQQVGEIVRDLGLEGQIQKAGTPTMGGIIILVAIVVPTLLFAKLTNVYTILLLVSTILLGLIGFIDDYIKVFKKDKEGLAGKFKVMGQIAVGLIVGVTLYFNDSVVVKERVLVKKDIILYNNTMEMYTVDKTVREYSKSMKTTIPFVKNNEFDYGQILEYFGKGLSKWAFLIFVPVVILIVTAVSNGANITDGLDGLASGSSAIIGVTLAIFAYVSGNLLYSNYLNIMYIPHSGEIVVFTAAFVGACVGFMWYNSYPAQVFMGDTGSLALGGIIAVIAISIRKELLLPILCGIFLIENLSVMIQVSYFKYTKKKYGEGKRIFKMAPLHHHYQKLNYHEAKIVTRFWIIGIVLAILSIITLKLR